MDILREGSLLLKHALDLTKTASETAQLAGQMQAALLQAQEVIRGARKLIDLLCEENTRLAQENARLRIGRFQ